MANEHNNKSSNKNPDLTRRRLLLSGGTAASLVVAPPFLKAASGDSLHLNHELFSLGVVSGDPHAHSVVLWTRLAPQPLTGGGMPARPVKVIWEVAEDYGMTRIVKQGVAVALPRHGHAVRVIAHGLPANRWWYYRFRALGQSSRVGRTRTFPGYRDQVQQMRCAVVSCQNYTQGFFTAYRDMMTQDLDFVVHTGDYIYENGPAGFAIAPGRNHNGSEIFSVEDYRNRYALYRLDQDLQEAHAHLPFILTWDDHEVDNNYAGLHAEESAPFQNDDFRQRRRNAYQVYSESMPLRPSSHLRAEHDEVRLFRKLAFGNLADIYMLDTRQFRSDQPAEDNFGSTDPDSVAVEGVLGEKLFDAQGILNPHATLLGSRQERWLAKNLYYSRATWNMLAQQIMVMPWNLVETTRAFVAANLEQQPIPAQQKAQILSQFDNIDNMLNVDAWDGYPAARERLFNILRHSGAKNPIVMSGDIHSAWAAELLNDFSDPQSDVLAAEFVCTSIASTFLTLDPRPTDYIVRLGLQDNPHIKFFNALFRGYCICDVNQQRWQTSYRAVGDLSALADIDNPLALVPFPDSPVATDAVLEIAAGFNQANSEQRLQTRFARFPT